MRYFPIWLDLHSKRCLLVGGGHVAAQKARLLAKAGADVVAVAPDFCVDMHEIVATYGIKLVARAYKPCDLKNCSLVIAATDNHQVNQQVSNDCRAKNILVNCVDAPAFSDFTNGAIIERDAITLSISSGGSAPVLARALKARLEVLIPAAYGTLAEFAGRLRSKVKSALPFAARRKFWEQVLNGAVAEALYAGQSARAHEIFAQQLRAAQTLERANIGEVYLIGAGPGDPELLTFKAQRLLQKADVIVYDRLVSDAIMNMARREAERIYVGKLAADHVVSQENISELLVQRALAGQKVARLKGGDPFIFGRGGEEISKLSAHNIAFQIVPAVSAASGCAAYTGIALSHRDYSKSIIYVTGHSKDDSLQHLNFADLAREQQTVVVYMGLKNIAKICQNLISHGAPATRPIAAIEQGTTSAQRLLIGTLADIADKLSAQDFAAPCIFIIGDVVKLNATLSWYQGNSAQAAFSFAKRQPELSQQQPNG